VFFSFFFSLRGQIFGVFFAPFPEEEISDYIAHGPIIRVLTVVIEIVPLRVRIGEVCCLWRWSWMIENS